MVLSYIYDMFRRVEKPTLTAYSSSHSYKSSILHFNTLDIFRAIPNDITILVLAQSVICVRGIFSLSASCVWVIPISDKRSLSRHRRTCFAIPTPRLLFCLIYQTSTRVFFLVAFPLSVRFFRIIPFPYPYSYIILGVCLLIPAAVLS